MEKRAFIAVILSLLVLIFYQEWMSRYFGTPEPPANQTNQTQPTPAPETASPLAAPASEAVAAPQPPAAGQGGKDVIVETDNYRAIFTSLGARLKSFEFKRYRSAVDEKSPPYEIVPAVPGVPLPLGIKWRNGAAPAEDGDINYSSDRANLQISDDTKGTLVFRGQGPDGSILVKTFTFNGATYPIELDVSVKGPSGAVLTPEVVLTEKSDHSVPHPDAPFEGVIALLDNKIKREAHIEPNKPQEFSGDLSWAGLGYTYFFFGVLPESGAPDKLSVVSAGPVLTVGISEPPDPRSGVSRYTLFIGPKELDTLKSLNKGLERSIDFGYFGFISIPFRYVLHFFHGFTGSYGLDIIVLTLLIKLLMAPLTHKSYVSMKQMQKLQPQMERLKEKFSNDKEKLNKEIMELYKRNGVNPLGGCLPMALQFPVFIGLYNALGTPIELRHAPFLWIKDLSRPDWQSLAFHAPAWWPHFLPAGIPVLTLLMGASMFVQQWMTPTAGDPNQKKMMMMMPLMFTFMFVSFPAGLTVYWLVNNVLTIGQQYWINRHAG
ncbi:MAG TPA: membrane protein insertase YidC [Candidatus Binatia bacterium]|jgi:YidC/Oxa1 family membrane protein insertase